MSHNLWWTRCRAHWRVRSAAVFTLLSILFLCSISAAQEPPETGSEQPTTGGQEPKSLWQDMPYHDEYLRGFSGDVMKTPSYDDVRCLGFTQAGEVVVGTSCGLVLWNVKDETYRLLAIEADWTPETAEKGLPMRACIGNYERFKSMTDDELAEFMTKGLLYSPGEFVVAFLRMKRKDEDRAVEACAKGIVRILKYEMKRYSSSEATMWLGLCGRDFVRPLGCVVRSEAEDNVCASAAFHLVVCVDVADCDYVADLLRHEKVKALLGTRLLLAGCLWRLKDIRAVDELVSLLDIAGAGAAEAREGALVALKQIGGEKTGVPMTADHAQWKAWLEKNRSSIAMSTESPLTVPETEAAYTKYSKIFQNFCRQQAEVK